jgi:hypothetical protein
MVGPCTRAAGPGDLVSWCCSSSISLRMQTTTQISMLVCRLAVAGGSRPQARTLLEAAASASQQPDGTAGRACMHACSIYCVCLCISSICMHAMHSLGSAPCMQCTVLALHLHCTQLALATCHCPQQSICLGRRLADDPRSAWFSFCVPRRVRCVLAVFTALPGTYWWAGSVLFAFCQMLPPLGGAYHCTSLQYMLLTVYSFIKKIKTRYLINTWILYRRTHVYMHIYLHVSLSINTFKKLS